MFEPLASHMEYEWLICVLANIFRSQTMKTSFGWSVSQGIETSIARSKNFAEPTFLSLDKNNFKSCCLSQNEAGLYLWDPDQDCFFRRADCIECLTEAWECGYGQAGNASSNSQPLDTWVFPYLWLVREERKLPPIWRHRLKLDVLGKWHWTAETRI